MMLGLGRKDASGKQVRIGHQGRNLRASRTGGAALRASRKVGKTTLTANSAHGVRVSRKVLPGTNVAFQNGYFRLRGRWTSGIFAFNLSKGGVSSSVGSGFGRLNLTNPNRSSFKMFGVQVRGKKAADLNFIVLIIKLPFIAIGLAFKLVWMALGLAIFILKLVLAIVSLVLNAAFLILGLAINLLLFLFYLVRGRGAEIDVHDSEVDIDALDPEVEIDARDSKATVDPPTEPEAQPDPSPAPAKASARAAPGSNRIQLTRL